MADKKRCYKNKDRECTSDCAAFTEGATPTNCINLNARHNSAEARREKIKLLKEKQ